MLQLSLTLYLITYIYATIINIITIEIMDQVVDIVSISSLQMAIQPTHLIVNPCT